MNSIGIITQQKWK